MPSVKTFFFVAITVYGLVVYLKTTKTVYILNSHILFLKHCNFVTVVPKLKTSVLGYWQVIIQIFQDTHKTATLVRYFSEKDA